MNVERFELEDKPITEERFDNLFQEWSILLDDVMNLALNTNWGAKFKWDTVTSFECLEDEVTRIENVCILHDFIAGIPTETLVSSINGDKDYSKTRNDIIDFMVWLVVQDCDMPAKKLLDNIDLNEYIEHRREDENE